MDETHEPVESVVVEDHITVRNLAWLMDHDPIDLIKVLMQYGIMAPITHSIDITTLPLSSARVGHCRQLASTRSQSRNERRGSPRKSRKAAPRVLSIRS